MRNKIEYSKIHRYDYSDERKKKLSESLKGKTCFQNENKISANRNRRKIVYKYDINLNFIKVGTIGDFCKEDNLTKNNIAHSVHKRVLIAKNNCIYSYEEIRGYLKCEYRNSIFKILSNKRNKNRFGGDANE